MLDVKRGDIGSTMAAYTAAYVAEKAAFAADAATVSPYLGFGALDAAVKAASEAGNGLFVLARTSNPEADALQRARLEDGRTVAQSVVDAAADHNAGAEPYGDVGVVVGATVAPGEVDLVSSTDRCSRPVSGRRGQPRRICGQSSGKASRGCSRRLRATCCATARTRRRYAVRPKR